MIIGILGTGMVGRAHAAKLSSLGHKVIIGTQNVEQTLARNKPDIMGNPPFPVWHKEHQSVKLATFAETTEHGEIVLNALKGIYAVKTLTPLAASLTGKILIDITNPLDFSKGMPPSLFVSNTDSLGEQIQRALPKVKVVKTFNTVNAGLQTDPMNLADGNHVNFVCGNDPEAKSHVIKKISEWYGWKNVLDLGDLTAARSMEMYLPLWLRLMMTLKTPLFSIQVVVPKEAQKMMGHEAHKTAVAHTSHIK
jgi:8-hydroxy-5-deazaflavin:NADPH oxidoreductase